MLNLLVRTLSQGLQAFMPVGVALIWYDRHGDSVAASATRRGLILSLPCTVLAAWAFQHSANQALVETLFGAVAAVIAAAFVRDTWRRGSRGPLASRGVGVLLVVVAAALIVVRPTKEVASVLWTGLMELGSVSTTAVILAGLLLAGCGVAGWMWVGRRASVDRLRAATRVFALGFLAQVLLFSVHEGSEAGVLRWSETVHAATEMYGPDGRYGVYLSALLLVVAFAALALPSHKSGGRQPVDLNE